MSQHKRKSEYEEHFRRRMRLYGIVWATCTTLPLFETMVFNAHVSTGQKKLSIESYLRMGWFFVILWAAMCFVFLVERSHVPKLRLLVREHIEEKLNSLLHNRKKLIASSAILLGLPITVFVFGGWEALVESAIGKVKDYAVEWLVFIVFAAVVWFLVKFVLSLGESLPEGLREGVESWGLGLRSSILFYGLLLYGTVLFVNFKGIGSDVRTITLTSLIKDYILLFMISGLLYLSLFKLARARTLMGVFQNKTGFVHFVVVCAIIAVLAVWADYNGLDRLRLEHLYNNEWQRQYMELHVFFRDIVLLLFPIGWLLVWTLQCAAHENRFLKQPPSMDSAA